MRYLALLAAFLALPTLAADHDPAFYARTGTRPPLAVDGFLGPSLVYGNDFGVGFHGGPYFKKTGLFVNFGIDAVKISGEHGTVTSSVEAMAWPHPPPAVTLPYSTADRTHAVYSVNFLFHVKPQR